VPSKRPAPISVHYRLRPCASAASGAPRSRPGTRPIGFELHAEGFMDEPMAIGQRQRLIVERVRVNTAILR